MELTSVSVVPSSAKKGQRFAINFELGLSTCMHLSLLLLFYLEEEITSGEVSVKVIYGGIPIIEEDLDLCNLITQFNRKCPLEKGSIPVKISKSTPDFIPSVRLHALHSLIY